MGVGKRRTGNAWSKALKWERAGASEKTGLARIEYSEFMGKGQMLGFFE